MKVTELRDKPVQELNELKLELLKEQFKLRMQKGSGQLTKNHLLTNVRRDIAQVNTILTEKQDLGA